MRPFVRTWRYWVMASDWVKTTLGEIVKLGNGIIQTGPFGSQLHASDYVDEGIPVIMPLNIINNKIDLSGIARITKEDAERLSKHLVKKNDIVYSRRGDVTRKALITELEEGMFCGTGCLLVRPGNSIDARFLTYHLSSPINQEWIIRHAVGATMPNLNTGILKRVPLNIPSLDTQKAIAHILGSLDDKIELNRQMNETLEAMAQALFKSWFVDFDPLIDNALAAGNAIPDEFIERAEQRKKIKKKDNSDIQNLFPDAFEFTEEMGWIPKGWSVKRIKDIGKVVTGKTPPKKIDNAYSEDGIPFITPTDIDDSPFVIDTNRYLSEFGLQAVKNSKISAGSICVTCIGSQMGKTTIAPFASVSNQQINSITDCNQFWRNYVFFDLRRRRDEIFLLGSSGSTMPILNKSNFEAVPILCPSENLLGSLDSHFQSTLDSILENTKQNQTLAKLRDTLLPKLMSGKLRIPDAAELVGEAI